MAHRQLDMVQETSASVGAGAIILSGAVTRRRAFGAVMSNNDTCHILIEHASLNEWEVSVGTYVSASNSLTRGRVCSSSTGAAVSFTAGVKTVSMVSPADRMLVMDELGNAVVDGALGIGVSSLTGYSLRVGKQMTGAVTNFGVSSSGLVMSDVTSAATAFHSSPNLLDAAFALTSLYHYRAVQGTYPAAVTLSNQYGFRADASLIGGATNYGIYSALPVGPGTNWNIYSQGLAPNYFAGTVAIGSSGSGSSSLRVAKDMTGAASWFALRNDGTIQSDVTGNAHYFRTIAGTAAAAFTTATINHFVASQAALGAGSAVTTQYGFRVEASLIGGVTNYGFHSAIPDAASRWNFYASGDAPNFFAGNVLIGNAVPGAATTLRVSRPMTGGATWYGIRNDGAVQADVTTTASYNRTNVATAAAAFTLTTLNHYVAEQGIIGAGSAVTNQYGFKVDAGLTAAANNYGFHSALAAGTGRWNFYASGTADNFFAGNVGLGTATPQAQLDLSQNNNAAPFNTQRFSDRDTTATVDQQIGKIEFWSSNASGIGPSVRANLGVWHQSVNADPYFAINFDINQSGVLAQVLRISTNGETIHSGPLHLGPSTLPGYGVRNALPITGATSAFAFSSQGAVQPDVTSNARYYHTSASVAAGATVSGLAHYLAVQGTFTGTVATQYGFQVGSSLTGATTNYGFHSGIAAGTGRWNFYSEGSAANAFNGNTRFGTLVAPVNTVDISGSFGRGNPIVKTSGFTLANNENWIINDRIVANTVTLPDPTTCAGREVTFLNYQALTLVSASANVVPPTGGAAGTAILPATIGAKVTLVSDGVVWRSF